MKLLTKSEKTEVISKELQREVKMGVAVATEVSKWTKKLNNAKAEYEQKTKEIEATYQTNKKDLTSKIDELLNEVVSLEQRKAIALEPLTEKTIALNKREEVLAQREEGIVSKEKELFAQENTITENALALAHKVQILDKREDKIRLQDNLSLERAERIRQEYIELSIVKDEFYTDLEKRQAEILSKEESLNAKNELIIKQRKLNSDREQELNNKELLLDSRSKTLGLAFAEAKKKGII